MFQQKPPAILATGVLLFALYGLFEIGCELDRVESEMNSNFVRRQLRSRALVDCGGHPRTIYGHVHIAETEVTSINRVLANMFERVCSYQGYSYDAFDDNDIAEVKEEKVHANDTAEVMGQSVINVQSGERDKILLDEMDTNCYENCDYVSMETNEWQDWPKRFGDEASHNIAMELHVPCRDPIEHLMAQCSHDEIPRKLNCDASTDDEYFKSVEDCFVRARGQYNTKLEDYYNVKCYDFSKQFTIYLDHMERLLENKPIRPDNYFERDTNAPRDKESECIWEKPDLIEKTKKYLLDNVEYFNFCDRCMGTEKEITRDPRSRLEVVMGEALG